METLGAELLQSPYAHRRAQIANVRVGDLDVAGETGDGLEGAEVGLGGLLDVGSFFAR